MAVNTYAPSPAVEDYVRAIHDVSEATGGEIAGTNAIASRLGVTPASASGMARRLEGLGLVTLTPYRGVELTPTGRTLALSVIRRHRLLETFLAVRLGIPWDGVHAEAEVLEHVISERIEEAIARDLGDPERDPHGAPIPRVDGTLPEERTVALSDTPDGGEATFVRIPDERPDMLRWLDGRGIAPGDLLTVTGRDPFGGPIHITTASGDAAIGAELADAMRVELR